MDLFVSNPSFRVRGLLRQSIKSICWANEMAMFFASLDDTLSSCSHLHKTKRKNFSAQNHVEMTLGAWEICSQQTLIVKRSAKVMFPVLLAKDCNPQRHWQQIWRFCPQIPSEFQQIVEGSLLGEISSRSTSLQVHHFPIFQCFGNHTVTSGPWIHPLTLWLNCQPKA